MSTIYAGPGKVWMNNKALWPQGENGEIKAEVKQRAVDVVSGFFGRVTGLQGDAQAIISLTPFDNWSALSLLFPAYLGVTVGATPGALALGTRPHNPNAAADLPAKIWSPDGRLYTFPRTAVTKHPDLHLGINHALFGPVELAALIASGSTLGGAGSLYTLTPSGATDPGGQQSGSDFQRGPWYGVWGTVAGFGGDGSSSPVDAEEEWVITTVAKYSPLPVQTLVRAFKLDNVSFMARCRPFGPSHSQIDAAIAINDGRLLGQQFADGTTGADLVLSGPNSKTITLKNADAVGAGFEFGGTQLGTGEMGFVTTMTFTSGNPQPLLVFSA
ncbi:MAG TPA: hypothetical protein VN829_22280 [Dongiaceae bacterium]|nr:hypothetical protein [Dongiaceae bacterium]